MLKVALNQCALRAEIPIGGHRNPDPAKLKEKAYLFVDFVYLFLVFLKDLLFRVI